MSPRVPLTVAMIVAAIFGVLLIAVPRPLLEGFGATAHDDGLVLARDLGALSLGFAALFFWARSWAPGPALRAVVLVGIGTQAFETLSNGIFAATGVIGPQAWLGVAIHAVLAILFVLSLSQASEAATPARA